MLNWFFSKSLDSVLNEKKAVKIKGVAFVIKKIDALSFLDGSKVMQQMYEIYKVGNKPEEDIKITEKKIKEHVSEVIVAGSVSPKFSFKDAEGCVNVNNLWLDLDIAYKLYEEILAFTYGKKKLNI